METRRRAIRILEDGHASVMTLVTSLGPRARTTPGLGGGTWSPRDLVGHLESWEEYALEALEHWERNARAPIDVAIWSEGVNRVNERAVVAKGTTPAARAIRNADRTHERLILAVRELSDTRWNAPTTTRGRRPLGQRVGSILGGPAGPFRHAAAHLPDLRAFAHDHAPTSR